MLAERARSRLFGALRQSPPRPKIAEASCARTVTFAFVRSAARSCQLHNGNVGLCSFILLPPSFLSGGPAQTLDRPLRGYHESLSLSPLAHALSLSLFLSLALTSPRARRRDVSTAAFRKRKQRTDESSRREVSQEEKEEEEEEEDSEADRTNRPRSRCRLRTSNRPTPPIQERRTATATEGKETHEGSALESDRLITYEDLSPSKDPAQHCETTLRGVTKSTSDISNS